LEARAGDLLDEFSQGMKRKVQLAAALIHGPQFLILDDPFHALDPETTVIIKELIRELSRKGIGCLIATHNLPVAQDLCHRMCLLSQGRVLALGEIPEILKETSASTLEAAYMALLGRGQKLEELKDVFGGGCSWPKPSPSI